MAPFQGRPVAIAVSGGVDSMALAFCLKRAGVDVHGLIVEHGLRDESAAEAKTVAQRLEGMGVPATILPWIHDGVKSRIHVEARNARYKLLVKTCHTQKITKLFVAHHQDDQAETILMRFSKGSGVDGLAGMAVTSEHDGVQIVRPLLGLPKARLVATCKENNIPFVTDPSNEKECYARGRLRRVSELLAAEGFTPERMTDLADRAREARDALHFYASTVCQESVKLLPSGALILNLEPWREAPQAVQLRVLSLCLLYINPTTYPPTRKHLLPFSAWIAANNTEIGRTLHGSSVSKNELKKFVTFARELSGITHELDISGVWDGRWRIDYKTLEEGVLVKALGVQKHKLLDKVAPNLRKRVPVGRQRAVLPALWRGEELLAVLGVSPSDQMLATASLKTPFWVKSL